MTPRQLLAALERVPRPTVVVASLLLAALLGALHVRLDAGLSFGFFYLLPVMLAAWAAGGWAGVAAAITATLAWLMADLHDPITASRPGVVAFNAWMRFAEFAVVAWTTAALGRSLVQERTIARTDFLTGVDNWRAFAERADAEIARARRYGRPLTFAYIDLDDFKAVNDRFGHAEGDRLLHVVADTIVRTLRRTDAVARLGGDEFAVLLPETGAEPAWIVLRKLHNAIRIAMEEAGWPVTTSIGAVTCPTAPADVDELVALADGVMYDVKHGGKRRVHHVVLEPTDASPAESVAEPPAEPPAVPNP